MERHRSRKPQMSHNFFILFLFNFFAKVFVQELNFIMSFANKLLIHKTEKGKINYIHSFFLFCFFLTFFIKKYILYILHNFASRTVMYRKCLSVRDTLNEISFFIDLCMYTTHIFIVITNPFILFFCDML